MAFVTRVGMNLFSQILMEIGEYERAAPAFHEALNHLEKGDVRRLDCHANLATANKYMQNATGSIHHWVHVCS